MSFWSALMGEPVKEVIKGVGEVAGNILDRTGFTKKMSEQEKAIHIKEILEIEVKGEEQELKDVQSARQMAIIQLQTQKASWLVRQLNGAFRPVAGWISLLYLTNEMWQPILHSLVPTYVIIQIQRDSVVDGVLGGIIAFFFGFRMRSKEKRVSTDA